MNGKFLHKKTATLLKNGDKYDIITSEDSI